mgnify:CR=1 FL=1
MINIELMNEFESFYGHKAQITAYAPGRVNLIGDHTDYNQGFVLPAAINFGTWIVCTKRADKQVNVIAKDFNHKKVSFNLEQIDYSEQASWSNYVRGSLLAILDRYPDIQGADILVSGNLPQGAGLSSSASFEIAIIKAFTDLYQLAIKGIDAAKMGQWAENHFVGCKCGIMDQLISALGTKGQAMLLDCSNLEYSYANIPEDLAIVIVNSNVKRGLVNSEYNTRRQQCESAASFFGKRSLREVDLTELEAAKSKMDPVIYRRARHVLSESERTIRAMTALNEQDIVSLSRLMAESHRSLKEDFEVTTPELDVLVDIVSNVLKDKGGARMTGGGFGGCVVALVPQAKVDLLRQTVQVQYPMKTGLTPDIYVCTAEQGAFNQ